MSFKPLLGMSSLHCWFFDHGAKSPRHAGGGHDVRCLHGVVADCSRHRWDRSSWFCVRSGMWITTIIQLRTWIVDTGIAHTQETLQTTHLDIFGGMPSKKKRKFAKIYCIACQYVQDAVSDGRPGRQRKSMFRTRSEAQDADGGFWCTAIQRRRHLATCLTVSRSTVKGSIFGVATHA